MNKKLFSDFESVSAKAWKQKIQVDLKGADYNDTLIWNTPEDINVKPFYHANEFDDTNFIEVPSNSWKICQSIYVIDAKKSNTKALDAINRGVESLKFIIPNNEISIEALIQNIDTSSTPLHFELKFIDVNYINNIAQIKGAIVHTDIIGQQLAYSLAHANEYLNHFKNDLKSQITFNVSIGTNYFFEIAKLRALRVLWKILASEYNVFEECHIVTTPTKRNKTLYDYNTNMLRTTTECMSAILGGADTICNLPYDAIYHKDNEFGERISRNQLLVLKHESYFDAVKNASDGAYYIESLTSQLAKKALELFKNIEANGGFLSQLKSGLIQKKIKESATKEQEEFNNGNITLLGTNKHPNESDRMKDNLELYPFLKMNTRKTLIEPIIERRLAETIEQNRLKTE